MSYFTCNEDGELNTLQFADGMTIMYDTKYQKSLRAVYGDLPDTTGNTYQGYLPRGWKISTSVGGLGTSVRGVNPSGRNNPGFGTTNLLDREEVDKSLKKLDHYHDLPVNGVDLTTDFDDASEDGGERMNPSIRSNYRTTTEETIYENQRPTDLNVPPQTRILFLVRSVGD